MPTLITRYVDAASTGGDGTTTATSGANAAYASLNAAVNAELTARANLVSRDENLLILCVGTTADTVTFSPSGSFTTDATRNVEIRGNLTTRTYSTSAYRYEFTGNEGIVPFFAGHLVLARLQIRPTYSGASDCKLVQSFGGASLLLDRCILVGTNITGGAGNCAGVNTVGLTNGFMRNCLVFGFRRGSGQGVVGEGGTIRLHNCTFADNDLDAETTTGNIVARNCVFAGDGLGGPGANWGASGNYKTAGSYGPGSGGSITTSQSFASTFVDAANRDYGLLAADTVARDVGADLSADANLPVTEDIIGTARPVNGTFDLGFHEYTAGGAAAVASPFYFLRRSRVTR